MGLDFATHHLSQKNPDEKEETLRVERIHVLADMYFCLLVSCTFACVGMSLVFVQFRHVSTFARLRNFLFSEQETFEFSAFGFPFSSFPEPK